MADNPDIAELRRTMIACTEATLKALAILCETTPSGGFGQAGTPSGRIRELAKQLPAP